MVVEVVIAGIHDDATGAVILRLDRQPDVVAEAHARPPTRAGVPHAHTNT
jgi:hypothetical protein